MYEGRLDKRHITISIREWGNRSLFHEMKGKGKNRGVGNRHIGFLRSTGATEREIRGKKRRKEYNKGSAGRKWTISSIKFFPVHPSRRFFLFDSFDDLFLGQKVVTAVFGSYHHQRIQNANSSRCFDNSYCLDMTVRCYRIWFPIWFYQFLWTQPRFCWLTLSNHLIGCCDRFYF